MSFFDFFKPKAAPPTFALVGATPAPGQIPNGFCRVRSGVRESIGYRNNATGLWCRDIGATLTVNDGRQVTLVPREGKSLKETIAELPVVTLNPVRQRVGGLGMLDTDSMPGTFDGDVVYDGTNAGPKQTEDPRAALDGCLW